MCTTINAMSDRFIRDIDENRKPSLLNPISSSGRVYVRC